jgi:hypothetical protein
MLLPEEAHDPLGLEDCENGVEVLVDVGALVGR